ncbi:MAG: polysaccharide deacetylase family protein [Cyclobacteriaceae bacterium]|nr:polysaccharide deacetylase family protein [Cyclobacteriaceae bacterium]
MSQMLTIRILAFIFLFESSLTLIGQNPDHEVVCFIYHRFGDSRYPITNVTLNDFEAHLQYLKKNNIQVLSLSDAIQYMKSSEAHKKTVVLTIDDGYKSFYEKGFPLLKKYNYPATLFINTETVGAADFMSWDQLEEVKKSAIEIGNHTHSHRYFLNEPVSTRYKIFEDEILLSQSIIQEKLKISPALFSFPYGEFDEKMKEIVKKAGFQLATAQKSGVWHEQTDHFEIPRFPMAEDYSAIKKFIEKVSMKPLKVSSQSPQNNIITPAEKQPKLTLTFEIANLQIDKMQCFAQGGGCNLKIIGQEKNMVTIEVHSSTSISSRRRTLYTVTVPDKNGSWHWISHLWINPSVDGK